MPATRLLLLLLIVGGLLLFALQNWLPVLPLVVLGIRTQALPLAIWMLVAIVAGSLTSIVIAGLFGLSSLNAGNRRPRSQRTTANQFRSESDSAAWNYGWSGSQPDQPPQPSGGYQSASRADDWEQPKRDDWDDWSGYQVPEPEPVYQSPQVETPLRDEADREWADWDGYDDLETPRDRPTRPDTRTVIQDEEPQPHRTDYEVPQEPTQTYQAGSVYSYSYRKPDSDRPSEPRGVDRTETVYDADYRVLRPPYKPLDDTPNNPPPVNDDEDWDFDDEDEDDWRDRPRRDDDW